MQPCKFSFVLKLTHKGSTLSSPIIAFHVYCYGENGKVRVTMRLFPAGVLLSALPLLLQKHVDCLLVEIVNPYWYTYEREVLNYTEKEMRAAGIFNDSIDIK